MQIPPDGVLFIAIGSTVTLAVALLVMTALQMKWLNRARKMGLGVYSTLFPWQPETRVREFVLGAIAENERRFDIFLTRAGREMLIIPIEEEFEAVGPYFDFGRTRESIVVLFESMAKSPSDHPDSSMRRHNAQAVVRAFHQRFCRIPPFCDGRGEAQ